MSADRLIPKLEGARQHLERAQRALKSARSWSIGDIILGKGLGLIMDIFEYSEFSKAKEEVLLAAEVLTEVEDELKEMEVHVPEINHTTLWMIFDMGFDSIIIDLLRHLKIEEAKRKVEETINAIDQLIFRLKEK